MRLTRLDISGSPLQHDSHIAQLLAVGKPLGDRGPTVTAIDSEGPTVTLADGSVYVWTPPGWGLAAPPEVAVPSISTGGKKK